MQPAQIRPLLRVQRLHARRYKSTTTTPQAQLRAGLDSTWGPLMPRLRTALPLLLALLTGLSGGTALTYYLTPSESPAPGTPADAKIVADLQKRIDELFLTKIYRGKCLAAGRIIRGEKDAGWREIDTGSAPGLGAVRKAEVAYERSRQANAEQVARREAEIVAAGGAEKVDVGKGKEERVLALKQQAEALGLEVEEQDVDQGDYRPREEYMRVVLAGSRALAVERVFWSAEEQELVDILWLGDAITGWPKIVHGGLIATVIGEKMALATSLLTGNGNEPALKSVEVNYRKTTAAADFYVMRTRLKRVPGVMGESIEAETTLETVKGAIRVDATGVIEPTASRAALASSTAGRTGSKWWQRLKAW